jgi:hypothetical protein
MLDTFPVTAQTTKLIFDRHEGAGASHRGGSPVPQPRPLRALQEATAQAERRAVRRH